jgi:hypothetical protein
MILDGSVILPMDDDAAPCPPVPANGAWSADDLSDACDGGAVESPSGETA